MQRQYREPLEDSQTISTTHARFTFGIAEILIMGLLAISLPATLVMGRVLTSGGTIPLLAALLTGVTWIALRGLKTGHLPKPTARFVAGSVPLLMVYAVGAVRQPEMQSLVHLSQLVLVVMFTAGFSLFRWSWKNWIPLLWSAVLFLGGHTLQWLVSHRSSGFSGAFSHRNTLAFAAYAFMYIPLNLVPYSKRHALLQATNVATIISGVLLLAVTSSRSSWIAAIVSLAVYVAWPFLSRNKFRYYMLFLLVIVAAVGGTAVYVLAIDSAWGVQLNELLIQLTGRRLFSGRNLFWGDLLNAIQASPLTGHGAGALAENFTAYSWSSHNLYLQVMLQVGLVGLVALFLFFGVVWQLLWAGRRQHTVRLTAAFLVGIMLREVFEVSMIQNNLQTGVFAWLIVAAGLSSARQTSQRGAP